MIFDAIGSKKGLQKIGFTLLKSVCLAIKYGFLAFIVRLVDLM